MTSECAVCYVSDLNFLLPTLVSASGLRKYIPADKADIYIFLIDESDNRIRELNTFLKSYNINVLPMNSQSFSGFNRDKFNKTHVPLGTLGRFFLDSMLPDSCRRIVYIDGDTWMRLDPTKLIEAIVPEGRFAAAEDISSLTRNDITPHGKSTRIYFKSIGIKSKSGYFNAGVFAVSRATWRTIASEAYNFFLQNTDLCRYHDQSALNAVMGDRRLPLSLKWNFHTPYRYWGVEKLVNPSIYHFTQWPKPWTCSSEPWTELFNQYQAPISMFKALKLPMEITGIDEVRKHNRSAKKRFLLLRSGLAGRLVLKKLSVRNYENNAWL